jgi:hypothetical protein
MQCCDTIHGNNHQRSEQPRGMLLDHTYCRTSTPAASTMNSATTLMTSHVLQDFDSSNIVNPKSTPLK